MGDALGRPFEMMSADDRRLATSLRAMLDPASARRWRYSDDGEMTIAVAESLVRTGGVSAGDLMASLASSYDPTRGYGHGMKLAIAAFERGRPPATASWQEGSKGNGGAVRVVPIACAYHDDRELLSALAEDSAGTTHAHPLGRAGAVAHAFAIASVLGHRGDWNRAASERLLTNAVLAGGDTDTIAAMSGALCGALVGEEEIPAGWIARLEHEPKGSAHVQSLADATFALWAERWHLRKHPHAGWNGAAALQ